MQLQSLIGMPYYEIIGVFEEGSEVRILARYNGPKLCAGCGSPNLRNKGVVRRKVRHVSWVHQKVWLDLTGHRWQCRDCGIQFRERFAGVLKGQQSSEAFRRKVFEDHWDGINRSRVAKREGISPATVERHCEHFLARLAAERSGAPCPRILGIDEHFFSRKHGYATTFCDLKHHSVYDVVPGRSEASLESYLNRLPGKDEVEVVCMDLSPTYRAIVRKHLPNARIVADRFHVIRLINHHFLACWKDIDSVGAKNRGLLSLMRRHRHNLKLEQVARLAAYLLQHPAMDAIYRFKQRLCYLLLNKHKSRKQCVKLVPRLLRAIAELRQSKLAALVTLGETLQSWSAEIAAMWRFTRNNGITEGFHTKMEVLQRQAYGFRNFESYRLRVKVLCS